MKVLWVTNVPIAEAPELLGRSKSVFGGWLEGMFEHLVNVPGLSFAVAFPFANSATKNLRGDVANYYTLPVGASTIGSHTRTSSRLQDILADFAPDVVHLFGTELPHAVEVMRTCRSFDVPVVLQLQGIMGSIERHYFGWLDRSLYHGGSPLERIRFATPRRRWRRVQRAAMREASALELATDIVGRTSYDRAWSMQNSPRAKYHYCGEILRSPFYEKQWDLRAVEPRTILLSQALEPYKGAHIALEALSVVKRRYPDVMLRIAGPHPLGGAGVSGRLRRSTYAIYLQRLILVNGLENNVEFVGALDAVAMCNLYLRSHIFISPSAVENSSNSIAEAAMLGLPVVPSYVGGVGDAVEHGVTGLTYQGDAPHMLAHHMVTLFERDDLARSLGQQAREAALARHDPTECLRGTLRIYDQVSARRHGAGRTSSAATDSR